MESDVRKVIEEICIALGFIGVIGLFQPFSFEMYKWAFQIMGIFGLTYIMLSIIPRDLSRGEFKAALIKTVLGTISLLLLFILVSIVLIPYILKFY